MFGEVVVRSCGIYGFCDFVYDYLMMDWVLWEYDCYFGVCLQCQFFVGVVICEEFEFVWVEVVQQYGVVVWQFIVFDCGEYYCVWFVYICGVGLFDLVCQLCNWVGCYFIFGQWCLVVVGVVVQWIVCVYVDYFCV